MIGIIVVGHNEFAHGISSTVEMVAGKQEHYEALTFLEGCSPEALMETIHESVTRLNSGSGVLVFTDLKGGTPHQKAIQASLSHEGVEVLSGTNVGMVLEASIVRTMVDDVKELATKLVQTGLDQISHFDVSSLNRDDDESEDGI